MKTRTTIGLAAVGVAVLAAGWLLGPGATGDSRVAVPPGTVVFPDLASKLQTAAEVDVVAKGVTTRITRTGAQWGLADRGGYRVQQDKLRELLTGLTELRMTEPRTSDPTQYDRLGVDDPNSPASTANLLRVLDAQGKPIAELITGHRRVRTAGNLPESLYIRRPGEAQSWLAEGRLPVDADAQLWLERDVINIAGKDVVKLVASRGDTVLQFDRDGDKVALTTPAEHPKLDEYRVDDVFRGLEQVTLSDVEPASVAREGKIGVATYTLAYQTVVTITLYRADKDIWATFEAKDGRAASLQPALAGWRFQIGAWKEKTYLPAIDELKASEPDKPAP